ncbi:hypothetical protein BT69DRAFT_1345476 [Atractiella rhizophila]|nr:hypothetical protein BT69DRAFT_1345476 [Atractiella rhizophila]
MVGPFRATLPVFRATSAANFNYARLKADNALFTRTAIVSGNNVASHARFKIKTRRSWKPNVQKKTFYSGILGRKLKVKATRRTWRTVEKIEREMVEKEEKEGQLVLGKGQRKRSAVDWYFWRTSEERLGPWGAKMRAKIAHKEWKLSPEGVLAARQNRRQLRTKAAVEHTKQSLLSYYLPVPPPIAWTIRVNRSQSYRPIAPPPAPEPPQRTLFFLPLPGPESFVGRLSSRVLSMFGLDRSAKEDFERMEKLAKEEEVKRREESPAERERRMKQATKEFADSGFFAREAEELVGEGARRKVVLNPFKRIRMWMESRRQDVVLSSPTPSNSLARPVGVDEWAKQQVDKDVERREMWKKRLTKQPDEANVGVA